MRVLIFFVLGALLFSSCLKEEEPMEPIPAFGAIQTAGMGQYYQTQLFYRLKDNTIVSTNKLMDWDISFDCSASSRLIRINNGRDMRAALTGKTDFESVTDTEGVVFGFDACSGNEDSVALNGWVKNEVAILKMGIDAEGSPLKEIKIQFWKKGAELHFRYGPLNNSKVFEGMLSPDEEYNAVYFSLLNNKEVFVEPPKTEYDLNFTRYIYYFNEEEIPYLVAGVLLNPHQTRAGKLFDVNFEEVEKEEALTVLRSENDAIGYNWKAYDFEKGAYSIVPNTVFIVETSHQTLYKFRFIDFYNAQGIKGHPKFEFLSFK